MTFFGNRNIGVGQTPSSITVTDVSTEILPANSARSSANWDNDPLGEKVWISCDAAAVVGVGPPMRPGGAGSMGSTKLTLGPLNGICESGKSSVVTFQDFNLNA